MKPVVLSKRKHEPPPIAGVVSFHRSDVEPGVRRGVVLDHGEEGARVMDRTDGTTHEVRHEGIYDYLTVSPEAFAEAVATLSQMGVPVFITPAQWTALEEERHAR
jgi:hypothetical protein